MAGARILRLRRADTCSVCATALAVGVEASWNAAARAVTCLPCSAAAREVTPPPVGGAGASARAEGDRRRAEQLELRRQRVERRPILGRLANIAEGPPTAGAKRLRGAVGEEKLGADLDALAPAVLALHDRRRLRNAANIDHIAVAGSGVWVIDAKRWTGLVEQVDKGTFFRTDYRLVVGGRDRTSATGGVQKQIADVREVLADLAPQVPVHGALCFVDAEWRLFPKPFEVEGVLVTWRKALWERVTKLGPLDEDRRRLVYERLASRLKPAG